MANCKNISMDKCYFFDGSKVYEGPLETVEIKLDQSEITDCQLKTKTPERYYSFGEMIKSFEDGFEGMFESHDGELYKYAKESCTLLHVIDDLTHPAAITSELVYSKFNKVILHIPNYEALRLAKEGKKVYFSVNIGDEKHTGTLTSTNGVASYSIDGSRVFNDTAIVIAALFNGICNI